jgi:transcriptional regulator with XRE-family HTH domain
MSPSEAVSYLRKIPMTVAEIATAAGTSISTINRIKRGKRTLSSVEVIQLALDKRTVSSPEVAGRADPEQVAQGAA